MRSLRGTSREMDGCLGRTGGRGLVGVLFQGVFKSLSEDVEFRFSLLKTVRLNRTPSTTLKPKLCLNDILARRIRDYYFFL